MDEVKVLMRKERHVGPAVRHLLHGAAFPDITQPRAVTESLEYAQEYVCRVIGHVPDWSKTMAAHSVTYWTPLLPEGDRYCIAVVPFIQA